MPTPPAVPGMSLLYSISKSVPGLRFLNISSPEANLPPLDPPELNGI